MITKYKILSLCIVFLLIFVFAGCFDTTSPNNGFHMATDIYIKFINEQGEDLLNPDHPHAITEQNTNLYYLIDGKKKKILKGNLDSPKKFTIVRADNNTTPYLMLLYPNILRGQVTATTYIAFEDYPTDTLKVKYINGSGVALSKIWYNGQLKWDVTQRRPRKIIITKHFSGK